MILFEYYEDYYLSVEAVDLVGQMNYTLSSSSSHIMGGSRIVYLANDDMISTNGASFIIGNDGSQTEGCATISARNAEVYLQYTLPKGYYDFSSEGATGFYIESLSSADIPIHVIITDSSFKNCFGAVVHDQGNDQHW